VFKKKVRAKATKHAKDFYATTDFNRFPSFQLLGGLRDLGASHSFTIF